MPQGIYWFCHSLSRDGYQIAWSLPYSCSTTDASSLGCFRYHSINVQASFLPPPNSSVVLHNCEFQNNAHHIIDSYLFHHRVVEISWQSYACSALVIRNFFSDLNNVGYWTANPAPHVPKTSFQITVLRTKLSESCTVVYCTWLEEYGIKKQYSLMPYNRHTTSTAVCETGYQKKLYYERNFETAFELSTRILSTFIIREYPFGQLQRMRVLVAFWEAFYPPSPLYMRRETPTIHLA